MLLKISLNVVLGYRLIKIQKLLFGLDLLCSPPHLARASMVVNVVVVSRLCDPLCAIEVNLVRFDL